MKKVSKKLNSWADSFLFIGVLFIVVAVIAWFTDGPASTFFYGACWTFVISPVFRGLSVLVQNAEEQIEERLKKWLEESE
jgi:hypothetical protein